MLKDMPCPCDGAFLYVFQHNFFGFVPIHHLNGTLFFIQLITINHTATAASTEIPAHV